MAAVIRHQRCRRAFELGSGIVAAFASFVAVAGAISMQPYTANPSAVTIAVQHGSGSQNPACTVLTAEEIRNITGFPGYRSPSPGDPAGEGAGGGASCQFEGVGPTVDAKGNPVDLKGPLLSIVLIEGKNYSHTKPVGNGCKKEPVPGVGDEAYFEDCPTWISSRTAPLYVKVGNKDLILQIDIDKPDTQASMRPKLIALAKAAAAKLRG